MADTDKLVKVGQLDTIVDEIVDKFGETNGRLVQEKTDLINSFNQYDVNGNLILAQLSFSDGYWKTDGELQPSTTTMHTEKMDVTTGKQYYIRFDGFTKIVVRNFNSDGTVHSSSELTQSGTFTAATEIVAFNGNKGAVQGVAELYVSSDLKSTLYELESTVESTESTNLLPTAKQDGHYINLNGDFGNDTRYSCSTYINVNEGDNIILAYGENNIAPMRFVTAYDSNVVAVPAKGAENVNEYTVPEGISRIVISALTTYMRDEKARVNNSKYPLLFMEYSSSELIVPKYTKQNSLEIAGLKNSLQDANGEIGEINEANIVIKNSSGVYITHEHSGYLTESGTYNGNQYHSLTTEMINCQEGDVFAYRGSAGRTEGSAVSALFYGNGQIIGHSHTTYQRDYSDITIPTGCDSVVFSSYAATGTDVVLYVFKKNTLAPGRTDYDFLQWKLRPLTTLPSYILNNLSYKPLGQLEHPYICLVTDDGKAAMTTRTIPLVLSKGVPMTFAIMSDSEVMQTPEDIAIVKNAVDNGGCSVAQHGSKNWTTYTEFTLNRYFDEQQAFFDSIEIPVTSAVIPSHYNSKMVFAVAGGRYGVVRSGYNGMNDSGKPIEPTIHYDYYTSGARSNLFGLSSYNVIDKTLEQNKQAIEYAIENNKILILYMHEVSMTEEYWTLLSDVIDYAKTRPITFINLGDIATTRVI